MINVTRNPRDKTRDDRSRRVRAVKRRRVDQEPDREVVVTLRLTSATDLAIVAKLLFLPFVMIFCLTLNAILSPYNNSVNQTVRST